MDTLTKAERSRLMSRVRSKDTKPERVVRSVLHHLGFRFRLHRRDLPGRPDVVLPKWRTVVLVHGCFWHGCTKCDRGLRRPKSNPVFWSEKLEQNRARDARVTARLRDLGWNVLTIWECETKDHVALAERLAGDIRRG